MNRRVRKPLLSCISFSRKDERKGTVYIRWKVEDGYARAKGVSHSFTIDDANFEAMTSEAIEAYVTGCIQEDFANKISWVRLDR